jgi:hypothetical protein
MAIPVELLFVFVLSHLLSAFLYHASHDLPSFLFMQNSGVAFSLTPPSPTGGEGPKGANQSRIAPPCWGRARVGMIDQSTITLV